MKLFSGFLSVLLLGALVGPPLPAQETGPRTRLALGDPRFKGRTVDVAPGRIISMETGMPVSFESMILDFKPVPFVFIGEAHDALSTHALQARVIQALFEQDAHLAVGLEMVAAARQETLSRYGRGLLTEEEYLRRSNWYTTWGFNFAYYRPIFTFARDHRIPLHAIDVPRDVVARLKVRDGEILAEEVEPVAPDPDPAEADGRLLLRTSLDSGDLPAAVKDRIFEDLYQAQTARDADMAAQAVRVRNLEGRKLVVLVGAGHLLYGLGLNGRVRDLSGLPPKSVVAVSVPRGRPSITVSRALADYIVGIPAEERPAHPATGLNFAMSPDSSRPMIASRPIRGVAGGRDFEAGDVVVSVDGRIFSDVEELLIHLAGIPWGGEAVFRLLRAGAERTVVLAFEDRPSLQLR